MCTVFLVGNTGKRYILGCLSIDGIIILKCILKKRGEGRGADLCGSGYGQAVVIAVMMRRISLLAKGILAVPDGFCFMELVN